MYLVGAAHPHKVDAQRLLEGAIARRERMVTSSEVLQDILHRYAHLRRLDAVQPAFDALFGVVDAVFPVEAEDVVSAKVTLDGLPRLGARDALHIAVMRRRKVERILTFDTGFDGVPGIVRLSS